MRTSIDNLKAISQPTKIDKVWVVDVIAAPGAPADIATLLLTTQNNVVAFRTKKEAQAFCAR